MTHEDIVVGIIALSDHKCLKGKIRLQKTAYLLEQCGMKSGLDFFYHYYGPYSSDVAEIASEDERIDIKTEYTTNGYEFTIFSTDEDEPDKLGDLEQDKVRGILSQLRQHPDVVLELAATLKFLRERGFEGAALDAEIKTRKPLKATDERLKRAKALLNDLGLKI